MGLASRSDTPRRHYLQVRRRPHGVLDRHSQVRVCEAWHPAPLYDGRRRAVNSKLAPDKVMTSARGVVGVRNPPYGSMNRVKGELAGDRGSLLEKGAASV